jgi:hypothetical protein
MAQIKRGACNPLMKEFGRNFRPNLSAPDLGYYTVEQRPNPGCVEGARRLDVGGTTWGRGGVPTMNTTRAPDSLNILAMLDPRPQVLYQTQRGPVSLPVGPREEGPATFTPTSAELFTLPYTGNRFSGFSDRYFK